jgi:hypothetical protein
MRGCSDQFARGALRDLRSLVHRDLSRAERYAICDLWSTSTSRCSTSTAHRRAMRHAGITQHVDLDELGAMLAVRDSRG